MWLSCAMRQSFNGCMKNNEHLSTDAAAAAELACIPANKQVTLM
jgi:hypothetical protein